MEIGIIGLPQSGKSTLFEIMTGVKSSEMFGEKFVKGMAKVPDLRFAELVEIFKPAKISPANISFVDVNASDKDAWNVIRDSLNNVDGLLHIVDSFSDDNINTILNNYRKLTDDLIISDLIVIENRLAKLAKLQTKNLKLEEQIQLKILPEAKKLLENGKPLREMVLNNDDKSALKGFTFWTMKPELIVLNIKESSKSLLDEFKKLLNSSTSVLEICCQIESEIAKLPRDDQSEFMKSLGIDMLAFEKIIRTSFFMLGRICYFTVGEDEVKAWVIVDGSTAPRAAAAIHKDFERGFIKAEVVSYDDFISNGKTIPSVKAAGKFRLEGKEYIVKDGDIINFRFNV